MTKFSESIMSVVTVPHKHNCARRTDCIPSIPTEVYLSMYVNELGRQCTMEQVYTLAL